MKNMPASALDNPMARQQKMLMYILPLVFAFSGVNFPIGVLIYWSVSNLWSMGQQFYTIRKQPAPGSEAYKARQERLAKKRARKGLPPEVDEDKPVTEVETPKGQRVQPKRKDRAKKVAPPLTPAPSAASAADDADPEDEAEPEEETSARVGKDGLTPEERAQKRYDERAAQRRAAAARRKAQAKNQGKKK
jgi:YidC/Oxa1 family membrane protein insertase